MMRNRRTTASGLFGLSLVLVLVVVNVPAVSAAEFSNPVTDLLLPPGVDATPQNVFYGLVLPFLLFFAILYAGIKNLSAFDQKEAFLVALVLSLFIVPVGYPIFADMFMTLFGVTEEGLPDTSIGGDKPTIGGWDFTNVSAEMRLILTLLVGAVSAFILSYKAFGQGQGLNIPEYLITLLFMFTTYMALGGAETLFTILGILLILSIGTSLIGVAGKRGGFVAKLFGLFGIMVVGFAFTQYSSALEGVPGLGPLVDFGNLLINAAGFAVVAVFLLVFAVLIVLYVYAQSP